MAVRFKLLEMASESSVGITCFANTCLGFKGVLRHRFSDFIVNEIDPDGHVVHFSSTEVPIEENKSSTTFSPKNRLEEFRLLAGDENGDRFRALLQQVSDGIKDASTTLLPGGDKSWRTQVHTFFKNEMPSFLTDTVENSIRIRYNDGSLVDPRDYARFRSGVQGRGVEYEFWPSDRKNFCQFHLYKENVSTQSAAMMITQKLNIKPKDLGFAGMKDKRAITTQRATVFKHPALKLASLNKELRGLKLGNFSYVDQGLRLGQLSGNQFQITIRDIVSENDGIISDAAEGLKKTGFINYYGLQRFGNTGIPTHYIGAKLLQGDWKGAIDLVLASQEGEQPAIREARKSLKNAGPGEALKHMPRHMIAERSILTGLKKEPTNYLQAIFNIPAPMRAMYVHSYQSYLWNHAVSFRVQKYGIRNVVEGDLVLQHNEHQIDADELGLEQDDQFEPDTDIHKRVQVVTRDDILSSKYTIEDVVLPLPGSSSVYPSNPVADVYHDLAKKDSLDLKESHHRVKNFAIDQCIGTYRRILVKPADFTWQFHDTATDNGKSDGSVLDLKFKLPPSVYATMAIRELMKISTEIAVHKSASKDALKREYDAIG